MGIMKKLFTAARGAATEAGEEIVDTNALRILDQEIRDAKVELGKSKEALADIMGKRKVQDTKLAQLKKDMAKYEEQALQLDESGELFAEVCERIDQLSAEAESVEAIVNEFASSEGQLKSAIKGNENVISQLERQVATVKATEQVQQASMAVSKKFSGNNTSLSSASASLERIREKQAGRQASIEANRELTAGGTSDLDSRLAAATGSGGISAADRLRAKKEAAVKKKSK